MQDFIQLCDSISNNGINFKCRKLPFSCLHTLQKVCLGHLDVPTNLTRDQTKSRNLLKGQKKKNKKICRLLLTGCETVFLMMQYHYEQSIHAISGKLEKNEFKTRVNLKNFPWVILVEGIVIRKVFFFGRWLRIFNLKTAAHH